MKLRGFSLLALTASAAAAVDVSTIYQFPNGTWLENIAQMQNGSLLVTMIREAEVYIVNPGTASLNATSSLVASFPGHGSVLGITEMQPNVFAVAVGNVTESNTPVNGTFAIYSLDFSSSSSAYPKEHKGGECEEEETYTTSPAAGQAKIGIIAQVPDQGLINGITFDLLSSTLYLADSWLGNIVQLNSSSGAIIGTIQHPALYSNFSVPGFSLGVNGVRVHGDYLYFSNTAQNLVGRIELNTVCEGTDADADIDGAVDIDVRVEILAQGDQVSHPDDLVVLEDGSVLLVRPAADTLQHISLDGSVEELARGGEVSGGTSVIKGKMEGEFYISTSGLEGGAPKEGGSVVRVEI